MWEGLMEAMEVKIDTRLKICRLRGTWKSCWNWLRAEDWGYTTIRPDKLGSLPWQGKWCGDYVLTLVHWTQGGSDMFLPWCRVPVTC